MKVGITAVSILLLLAGGVGAYDLQTHTDITTAAVAQSKLALATGPLTDLGLRPFADPLQTFPNSEGSWHRVDLLFEDGARFEDYSYPTDGTGVSWYNWPWFRVRHHFYDPFHDTPLNSSTNGDIPTAIGCLFSGCEKSPRWALEDEEDFSFQDHSFRHAREAFLEALTLQNPDHRKQRWGRTFESLGRIVHHLQDMAQPQHVRNDVHLSVPVIGYPSLYERYTEEIVEKEGFKDSLALSFPTVSFPDAADFWATQDAQPGNCEGGVCFGRGIAQFTSYNFLSIGTNFEGVLDVDANGIPTPTALANVHANASFPRPTPANAFVEAISWSPNEISYPFPIEPPTLAGKLYLIGSPIRDDVVGPSGLAYISTFSIYDDELKKYNKFIACAPPSDFDPEPPTCTTQLAPSVNRINFESGYPHLLPRARAYSTGLIDYFFRGRLGFRNDPDGPGSFLIENKSEETMQGTFRLYADDFEGIRHPVQGLSWTSQQLTIVAGGAVDVAFVPQSDLPPDTESYTLVFQGRLGEEANAVAAKHVVADPVGFVNPAGRLVYGVGGWQFAKNTSLQYGPTNWYGTAGAVSWQGPLGRSAAPAIHVSTLSDVIYRDGRPMYRAPGRVIGAALRDMPDGTYLVVIVPVVTVINGSELAMADQAYRAKLEDEVSLLWEPGPSVLYESLPRPPNVTLFLTSTPDHYFFNASGTEAQSLRQWQRITFSWESGFVPALRRVDSAFAFCNTPQDVVPKVIDVAADYRGDELRLATLEYDFRCGGVIPGTDIWSFFHGYHDGDDRGQDLLVGEFSLAMPNTFDASGAQDTQPSLHRRLSYLDLRTPFPTVVFHDDYRDPSGPLLMTPGWVVNGGFDPMIGPVRPQGADAGPTVGTDTDGRVILDWPYYDVSLLYPPPGTPESLTGSVGPVGVL